MKSIKKVLLCAVIVLILNSTCSAVMLRNPRGDDDEGTRRIKRPLLPNTGAIAVLVEGSDPQHSATAEAMIIEELVSNGYKVINDSALAKMHEKAVTTRALQNAFMGNISGISNLNGSYKASATIIARVKAGIPERNEFKLYTGTASAVIMAVTSNGNKLGGKTSQGKAVGYTMEEARQNALESAVEDGLSQLF